MKYEQLSNEHQDWKNDWENISFNLQALLRKNKNAKKEFFTRQDHAHEFIKVPFKDALSLVSSRQVYLKKGFAYVHISDLNVIART